MSSTTSNPTNETATNSTSAVTGNANAGGAGNDLAQTIAQAVGAAVQTAMGQVSAQLASISEAVNKTVSSAGTDVNFEANVTGAYDPYESMRRDRLHFDQVQQLSLQALANAVETANLVGKQAVRHADAWMAGAGNAVSAVKPA